MTATLRVGAEQQEQLLQDAIYRHASLTLSCRLSDGWACFDSWFLASAGDGRQIVIAYPELDRLCPPEFVGGEHVGVAFRRGHKRCVMNTLVIRQCRFAMTRTIHLAALVLAWPDAVYELRRRLYYRAPLPPEMSLPVELTRRMRGGSTTCRGELRDISVGGLSVIIQGADPGWRRDHAVSCRFNEDPAAEPLALASRVCYCEAVESDSVRMGVRFADLDTGTDHGALGRIIRFCSHLQRLAMDRGCELAARVISA